MLTEKRKIYSDNSTICNKNKQNQVYWLCKEHFFVMPIYILKQKITLYKNVFVLKKNKIKIKTRTQINNNSHDRLCFLCFSFWKCWIEALCKIDKRIYDEEKTKEIKVFIFSPRQNMTISPHYPVKGWTCKT